jgi:hypothetical protein
VRHFAIDVIIIDTQHSDIIWHAEPTLPTSFNHLNAPLIRCRCKQPDRLWQLSEPALHMFIERPIPAQRIKIPRPIILIKMDLEPVVANRFPERISTLNRSQMFRVADERKVTQATAEEVIRGHFPHGAIIGTDTRIRQIRQHGGDVHNRDFPLPNGLGEGRIVDGCDQSRGGQRAE